MKVRLFKIIISGFIIGFLCSESQADARVDRIKAFEELATRVQRREAGITEQDMIRVLAEAAELGRPFSAEAAVKSYSVAHPDLPDRILRMAAENAFLAGDFRTSVARYKSFLAQAEPGRESSDAAAMMMLILIDFLDAGEEAYSFVKQEGGRFRQSDSARRFDRWFLDKAVQKNDVSACADRLLEVFSGQIQPEQARFFYWDYLDWLMDSVRRPVPGFYPVIPVLNELIPLTRADEKQQRQYALVVANLEFHAGIAGKTGEAQEKLFAPVAAAADACFKADPSASVLQEIMLVFNAGSGRGARQICGEQKQDFFVRAFGKLSEEDKIAMIRWMPGNASGIVQPDRWAALCASYPRAFAEAEQFVYTESDHELYRKQAPFLEGRASVYAAIVNSLAAGDNLDDMARHLLENESWHLELAQSYDLIKNRLWPIFRSFPQTDGGALAPDYYSDFLARFGTSHLLRSPVPLADVRAASEVIMAQWESGVPSDMPGALESLNWLPYTGEERHKVFGPAYEAFKSWVNEANKIMEARTQANERIRVAEQAIAIRDAAETAMKAAEAKSEQAAKAASAPDADDKIRESAAVAAEEARKAAQAWNEADKQAARAAGAAADARTALERLQEAPEISAAEISAIEEAFQTALDPDVFDVEKAPDPLCKGLARLLAAARDGNKNEYEKIGREVYAKISGFDVKKTPYGAGALELAMRNRLDVFDTIDFQIEVFADQLARWTPASPTRAVNLARDSIVSGRQGWPSAAPAADRQTAQKMIDVLEKALLSHLDNNRFWPVMFDWFRAARSGRGWRDDESGLVVLGRLIEEKTLLNHPDYRLHGRTAAATYMWLVHNEFIRLRGQYPVATWFDDMYLEECAKTGKMDFAYWTHGTDSNGKIVNMAMANLLGLDTLPYTDKEFQSANELWRWHNQCLAMNAGWRNERGVDEAARAKLIAMLNAAYGKTRFDQFARGSYYFTADAKIDTAQARKEFFSRLSDYAGSAMRAPVRVGPPNLAILESLSEIELSEAEVLASIFPDLTPMTWAAGSAHEKLPALLHDSLLNHGRYSELMRIAPFFWKMAKDLKSPALSRALADNATRLLERQLPDLAAAYSISGLDIVGAALPEDARIMLTGNRMKALVGIGEAIPVDRHDPRFPIFAAQTAYLSGNLQNAWELYLTRPGQVVGMFKDLDPEFSIWLIRMNTESQEYERADELARGMMQWLDSLPEGFDRNLQARVMIAYADIAFSRQEFPRARALYQRIVADKSFEGTRARLEAEFRIADVERVTRNYTAAVAQLEKLARERERWVQVESCYQLARIRFEQEDYIETASLLDYLFALEPGHVAGKLLEGRLNLHLKRYQRATDIEVGLAAAQKMIVPGQPLNIHLEDRNLSVVGKSREIEVRVWTDSGDEEMVSLLLSAHSKTRFEGSIPTEMGPPAKGDRMLQVLGNDTVYYDYSDAFKQAHNIVDAHPMSMSVASDSVLLVSSGELVSEEEEQERGFRRVMEMMRRAEDLSRTIEERDIHSIVRPGNKIYVRVIDPDRSVTPDPDAVTVRVSAYSGDTIPNFVLREVAPYSGVFEGAIPTVRAGALAYATDSTEGRLPSYAISKGAFPPWQAFADNVRPKSFSVDINDNVLLGKMNIVADVPGRRLREFFVQTSFDNRNFTTVAGWPTEHKPWDGTPGVEFVGLREGAMNSAEAIRQYIETDSVGMDVQRAFVPLTRMIHGDDKDVVAFSLDKNPIRTGRYVARFRAAFYLPHRQTRMFKLEQTGGTRRLNWFVTLDEKGPDSPEHPNIIRRAMNRGIHFLDIYISGQAQEKPVFQLFIDSDQPPYAVLCPISMFDPIADPDIRANIPDQSAGVVANEEQTEFEVAFAPGARGRVIRLVMSDFEMDAPAIRGISLVSADGTGILPVETDPADGAEPDVLKLVAGDRVSIVYEDPKVITEGREVQERFMTAQYHDGEIYACIADRERMWRYGEWRLVSTYTPLFRFTPGEKFDVLIDDPDLDVSSDRDVAAFSARTELGDPIFFKALETEEHSGLFLGSVFTVTNEPTRPDELRVEPGENVILSYEDEENTDPGIPWTRTYMVEQVVTDPPELRVYSVTSIPLAEEQIQELRDPAADDRSTVMDRREYFVPTRNLIATRPTRADPSTPASVIAEGPLLVELIHPAAASATNSVVEIYAQSLAARKAAGMSESDGFDPDIPGTVKLSGTPSDFGIISPPQGYLSVFVRGDPYASSPLRDGRFSFNVPKAFGTIEGDTSLFGHLDAVISGRVADEEILFIRSDDDIFIGVPYTTVAGSTNWITQRVVITSDMFMDVMDRYYQETVEDIFVGQNLYLRINHRCADKSDQKDSVSVSVATESGFTTNLTLVETFEHSGSFRGVLRPVYFEDDQAASDLGAVRVKYGDTITIKYRPPDANEELTASVFVRKGADGEVMPFTKQFADPETAVQTQFAIAEAYFELAKKHRALDQASLARRQIAQGRRLLEEVIRDYPHVEIRAQADYLLADLAMEYADDAVDEKIKREKYLEAINLFTAVIMTYPDSMYAPRAQYKKALAFEKMGDIDRACEEYVKLSYLYPDNELIAETIARLGTYFSSKGRELEAKALAAVKEEEREEIAAQSRAMFKTAADVFSRLAPRFPTHSLASKTLVLSGQCYIRAEETRRAVEVLGMVIRDYQGEHDIVAEAMYWRGDAYLKLKSLEDAYREFKRLTWDYPASRWAKFARGRLTEPDLSRIHEAEMR